MKNPTISQKNISPKKTGFFFLLPVSVFLGEGREVSKTGGGAIGYFLMGNPPPPWIDEGLHWHQVSPGQNKPVKGSQLLAMVMDGNEIGIGYLYIYNSKWIVYNYGSL